MEQKILKDLMNYCNSFNQGVKTNPPGTADEACRNSNSDLPGGFQDVPPILFVVIGQILGNVLAGNLPLNVQNTLGNWLGLVGQTIVTFAGQQQYFQGGPGRYYNPIYRNASNPFCPSSGMDERGINDSGISSSGNTPNINNPKNGDMQQKVNNLENDINNLRKEIYELKKIIRNS